MAFITGTANNADEILIALKNSCTANGWVLTNGILSKGDCYVKAFINDNTVALLAGTGQNGSDLTNAPTLIYEYGSSYYIPGYPHLWVSLAGIDMAISYPVIYSIHIMDNPKEVYLFINHNIDSWSYIAFGQSPIEHLPGTGVWYGGTGIGESSLESYWVWNEGEAGHINAALFSYISSAGYLLRDKPTVKSFFHHGISDIPYEWSLTGVEGVGSYSSDISYWHELPTQANATLTLEPLMAREPSVWNSSSTLYPIQPSVYRPDYRRSIVGSLGHARYARIDYIDPGQIVTLGNERWRFYPWLKKNIADRDMKTIPYDKRHTGTYGVAIRYDGD